jgi:hypothetical protein
VQRAAISNKITAASRDLFDSDTCRKNKAHEESFLPRNLR